MNAKRIATLTLIFTVSIVCLLNNSVASYPEGTWDMTTIATKSTLEATHIVVGEVTDVSFVFYHADVTDPLSIVTVRVDKDIKAEIERVANAVGRVSKENDAAAPGGLTSEDDDESLEPITFLQVGGPKEGGGRVRAVGLPVLKVGDYVFLRLRPTNFTVSHNGTDYNSITDAAGTLYSVEAVGDDVDRHIIKKGWQALDINVGDMTRIVRTTLEQPETMRTLEREVNATWGDAEQAVHLNNIMATVAEIEETLNLPSFDPDDQ